MPTKTRKFAARPIRFVENQRSHHTRWPEPGIQHRFWSANHEMDPECDATPSNGNRLQDCIALPFEINHWQFRCKTLRSIYREFGTPRQTTRWSFLSELCKHRSPSEAAVNNSTITKNDTVSPQYVGSTSTASTIWTTAPVLQKAIPPIDVSTIAKQKVRANTETHHNIHPSFLCTKSTNQQMQPIVFCQYFSGIVSPERNDAHDSSAALSNRQRPKQPSAKIFRGNNFNRAQFMEISTTWTTAFFLGGYTNSLSL